MRVAFRVTVTVKDRACSAVGVPNTDLVVLIGRVGLGVRVRVRVRARH